MDEQLDLKWSWDDLRTILAISRTGSLSGAARLLGSSHPTIYRRVRDIEQRFSLELFERTATGYLPTPTCELVLETAERMAADVQGLDAALGAEQIAVRDTLRVSCSDTIFFYVLGAPLASFKKCYPEVTLDIQVTNDFINLQRHEADIAIRVSRRSSGNLHGVRLADIGLGVHAHKDHPAVTDRPLDITAHDWIGFDESMSLTGMARLMAERGLERNVAFRVNSLVAACEAVRQGMGLAIVPYYAKAAIPDIVALEAPEAEIVNELWIVSMPATQRRPAARAFFQHMQAAFAPLQPALVKPTGG